MSVIYSCPTLPSLHTLDGHTHTDIHTGGALDSRLWPVIHEIRDTTGNTCPVAYAWLEWCGPGAGEHVREGSRTLAPRVSLHHADGSFSKWAGPSRFAIDILKDAAKKWKTTLKVVPTRRRADGEVVYELPRAGASRLELVVYVGSLPCVLEQAGKVGVDIGVLRLGPEGEPQTKEAKKRKSQSPVRGEKKRRLAARPTSGDGGRKESKASTDSEGNGSDDNGGGGRKFSVKKRLVAGFKSGKGGLQKEEKEGEPRPLMEAFLRKLKEAGELAAQLVAHEAGLREKYEEEVRRNERLLEEVREEREEREKLTREVREEREVREKLAREVREERARSEELRLENKRLKEVGMQVKKKIHDMMERDD